MHMYKETQKLVQMEILVTVIGSNVLVKLVLAAHALSKVII